MNQLSDNELAELADWYNAGTNSVDELTPYGQNVLAIIKSVRKKYPDICKCP